MQFYDKAAAHLWRKLALYYEAGARIEVILAVLALESRRALFALRAAAGAFGDSVGCDRQRNARAVIKA